MVSEANTFAESLQPLTRQKLIDAIALHSDARKYCKKELGRLRRIIRRFVWVSPEKQRTMRREKNVFIFPKIVTVDIKVFDHFVSWYNKFHQHEVTITKLENLLDTFEPVMEPPDAQTPIPTREGSDVTKEEHPNKTRAKKPHSIPRPEVNAIYEKYVDFFIDKFKKKMKETNEKYGATKYAAGETVKEIYKVERIKIKPRNLIEAMNRRTERSSMDNIP
jgi:hypothetical protein